MVTAVYYEPNSYWNDFAIVREHLNRRATDDPSIDWVEHLRVVNGGRQFRKALILNCGNGWVERELFDRGLIFAATGTDISEEFVEQCRREAGDRLVSYVAMDINRIDEVIAAGTDLTLTWEPYDLIVNYAACHHIEMLDRVLSTVRGLCAPDAIFVSWDYMGPDRNQYPNRQWRAIRRLNDTLPSDLRKKLQYPSLPTMLVHDPSEAIRSSRVHDSIGAWFDVFHDRDLGGGLAYEVITHNRAFFDADGPRSDVLDEVRRLLVADEAWTSRNSGGGFRYVLARPRTSIDPTIAEARLSAEREQRVQATRRGGRYGRRTWPAITSAVGLWARGRWSRIRPLVFIDSFLVRVPRVRRALKALLGRSKPT